MSLNKKKTVSLQQTLEHRILHGLSCEWDTALWGLDESYRRLLQKPIFGLRNMDRCFGVWDSDKKEISLSRSFVLNHSWYAVRDVLLHEMAHQIAYQVFGASDETGHGPSFKKASGLLRIDSAATGHYQELGADSHFGESDKILMKVKKLLALAESQNIHEAEAAMLKAHQLIEKYNVDVLALNEKRGFITRVVGSPALRHTRDKYHLANLLQDYYFVQGIWIPSYVVNKGKMGRVFEISGTSSNVEIAAYVYDFICNYIQSQWAQYNDSGQWSHHRRTDYANGILEGFRKKLAQGPYRQSHLKGSGELVAVGDQQLHAYMAFKYPHTRSVRRCAIRMDKNVNRAGMAAGEKLIISKGITEKGGLGKLIGLKTGAF